MKQRMLPLFPLNVVLFPRTPLPLHIFEDRYKQMITEVLEDKSEFGVVLAGEKGICNSGCTAAVDKVLEQYPDGRMDLLTVLDHELGHALGFEHEATGVMEETLPAGTRRTPTSADVLLALMALDEISSSKKNWWQ